MAKKISAGIEIDGEKEFRQAVNAINSDLNVLKSEMKLVTAEFIDNEDSIKSLKAQQEVLNKQINEHSEKCNILKSALQNATKAYQENVALLPKMEKNLSSARNEYERTAKTFGKNSDEAKAAKKALDSAQKSYDDVSKATQHARSQMNHWQKALNETTADIHKMKKNLDDLEDKSKVINRLKSTFDSLTDKIDDAKEKTEKFRDGLDKIGDAAKKGVKVATGAITVAGGAIVALTKNAVENYAEYEQLIGGVETLFGAGGQSLSEYAKANNATWAEVKKDYDLLIQSQQDVIDNANVAYKTAGISANEYMSTVTSFSASLLQSLEGDTIKAAEKADQALIDMSDNANKMGSDMQSIQNAYQGFAKQNYTMLDNLKLGYGGTKEEMERLLDDAAKLDKAFAKQFKDSGYDMSFSNVVDAIHIIQSEMGITGTTAKEASTTITGSISSMQASWQNLLTGIADENQNTDDLIDYFVDSVVTVGENVTPVVEESLKGIGDLIEGLAPVIVNDLLPSVMNDVLPDIAKNATEIISTLTKGLSENKEGVINSAVKIITELGTGLIGCAPDIIDVGMDLIIGLIDGLTSPESMEKLIGGAIECIGKITSTLLSKIPDILTIGGQIIEGLWEGIKNKDGWIGEKIAGFFANIKQSILDIFDIHSPSRWASDDVVGNIMNGFVVGFDRDAPKVKHKFDEFMMTLTDDVEYSIGISSINAQISPADISEYSAPSIEFITDELNTLNETEWDETGKNIVDTLLSGLKDEWKNLDEWFAKSLESLKQRAENLSDINVSLNLTSDDVVGDIMNSFVVGFDRDALKVKHKFDEFMMTLTDDVEYSIGISLINAQISPADISEYSASTIEFITDELNSLNETDWDETGKNIVNAILNGIKDAWDGLNDWVIKSFEDLRYSSENLFDINISLNLTSDDVVGDIMNSFVVGFDRDAPKVKQQFDSFMMTMTEDLEYKLRISDINAQIASADIPESALVPAPVQPEPTYDDKFDRMLALLEIIAMNSKKDILIDKKTLVAEIVPEVNEELGDILVMQERGA